MDGDLWHLGHFTPQRAGADHKQKVIVPTNYKDHRMVSVVVRTEKPKSLKPEVYITFYTPGLSEC